MGNSRSAKRNLSARHVWIAQETQKQKIALAKKMVEERCKKDAEFAADVLKAVGENLPKEIREAAEATIAQKKIEDMKPIVGGDETYKLTKEVQLDGGGTILVDPNEDIVDGPNSAIDVFEKSVQMDGPKSETA